MSLPRTIRDGWFGESLDMRSRMARTHSLRWVRTAGDVKRDVCCFLSNWTIAPHQFRYSAAWSLNVLVSWILSGSGSNWAGSMIRYFGRFCPRLPAGHCLYTIPCRMACEWFPCFKKEVICSRVTILNCLRISFESICCNFCILK